MNTQLLEALCKDFAAIYQCELIQDTIDIVRFDKGTPIDMAIQTLDLYTLHSFSKMIHGTIQMESKEDAGTTFWIILPLQIDFNLQTAKPIQTNPLNLTNKKALLVEDNDINLEIATILLQDLGFDVSTARNGQKAIDQFKKSKLYTFDYIFMDPPYNQELERQALSCLKTSALIDKQSTIIIEASLETSFDYLESMGFLMEKNKQYKTNRHVFVYRGE